MRSVSLLTPIPAGPRWRRRSTVLKTTDGGASWIARIPSPNSCAGVSPYGNGCNLKGISFIDASTGWAAGAYGTIWKTINGGTSWTAQSLPGGTGCGGGSCVYAALHGIHFINSTVGIAVGPSYAFATGTAAPAGCRSPGSAPVTASTRCKWWTATPALPSETPALSTKSPGTAAPGPRHHRPAPKHTKPHRPVFCQCNQRLRRRRRAFVEDCQWRYDLAEERNPPPREF